MKMAEELSRIRAEKLSRSTEALPKDLMEWIPSVSPGLMSPRHLVAAADQLKNFVAEPFEFVFSVPPRHGKTVLVLHFIVWAMKMFPSLKIAYVSYAANQAEDMSADALKIADRAALNLSRRTRAAWETPEGGKVHWVGVGGALTGKGYQLVIVDDPVKNRVEAESPVHRERAWNFFRSDLYTRLEAGGPDRSIQPSIAVIQTRWHDDDLAGRLTKGDEEEDIAPWNTINIPAIANEGTEDEAALCEELVPLRRLHKIKSRVGPYAWSSLYQGHPMPQGSTVFGDPTFFSHEPPNYRSAIGLDLAYTAKTSSDHSVAVTMLRDAGTDEYYVVRVRRRQLRAPDFKEEVLMAKAEFPRSTLRIYAGGTERGSCDFLNRQDLDANGRKRPAIGVAVLAPNGDKFTRAIPFAAAWNTMRVRIPSPELVTTNPGRYGWVNDYLDELKVFTGVKDASDDQVDASAAAYDQLSPSGSAGHTSVREVGGSATRRTL
jgi:predicted phage terminase large subunit-like protein